MAKKKEINKTKKQKLFGLTQKAHEVFETTPHALTVIFSQDDTLMLYFLYRISLFLFSLRWKLIKNVMFRSAFVHLCRVLSDYLVTYRLKTSDRRKQMLSHARVSTTSQ